MSAAYEVGRTPRIVSGAQQLSELGAWAEEVDRPILLIGDRGVRTSGLLTRAQTAIGQGRVVETFVAPPGEPTAATVDATAEVARRLKRPAIVGLGGGTVLDLAKLTAALAATQRLVAEFALGADAFAERLPVAMVPTTAGTGAEVTRTCIVAGPHGRKLWVWDPCLIPDLVILDPSLTVSLPRHLTVATGLDAFVHALEATTGKNRNPVSEACALQAIRLVRQALTVAATNPSDLHARQTMQEAAILAGLAIDSGGTGIAHTIGHALGSLYHIPHGLAVALGLQATLDWSVEAAPMRYQETAAALHVPEGPEGLAAWVHGWMADLGLREAIRASGVATVSPEELAAEMAVPENAPMAANNARVPGEGDLATLAARTARLWNDASGLEGRVRTEGS